MLSFQTFNEFLSTSSDEKIAQSFTTNDNDEDSNNNLCSILF